MSAHLIPQDRNLREQVLSVRLGEIVDKLTPHLDRCHIMTEAIFAVIRASHLNSFDPMLAFRHRSDGILRRSKEGDQDISSLSLFRDDVERLLRDLYGDFESEALESVLFSVSSIVRTIANYECSDLAREDFAAGSLDYMRGIGVPEGCGFSGSDHRDGMVAKIYLTARVRDIFTSPSCGWKSVHHRVCESV